MALFEKKINYGGLEFTISGKVDSQDSPVEIEEVIWHKALEQNHCVDIDITELFEMIGDYHTTNLNKELTTRVEEKVYDDKDIFTNYKEYEADENL